MKSELRRYSMEIEDVPYARVPQSYINEYEDKSGEWVYADVAISVIKELEEQNEKMLNSLKMCTELLMLISMDPANSPFPLTPVSDMRPQILDVISNAVEVITDIEGQQ